jgi:hypothetical protein
MRMSREALFERLWSTPMRTLAPEFGISDVALRKACVAAGLPVPERGYWAKLAAGKRVIKARLPAREPGRHPKITVSGSRYQTYSSYSREELLGPIPEVPSFDEPIEAVEQMIQKIIRKVPMVRSLSSDHHAVGKLLKVDEVRREKQRNSPYPSFWNAPLFDSPFEQRRLRILNSLFLALMKAGGVGSISGKEGREVTVRVCDEHVHVRLDTPANLKRNHWEQLKPADPKASMKLVITTGGLGSTSERWSWEDSKDRIEVHLTEIAQKIILTAELQVRESATRHHQWWLDQRARLIEEDRLAKEKAEREERERQKRLAKARVDKLLGEAEALRRAETIRLYVSRVMERSASSHDLQEIEAWCAWAQKVADGIDPVTNGDFLQPLDETAIS